MNGIDRFRLKRSDSVLVIVDIQERLAGVMKERDRVVKAVTDLLALAGLYEIPVVVTEQYPKGLGPTVEEIASALDSLEPIEKITFSCCGEKGFTEAIEKTGRRKVILTGMETHVCVLQTCLDLLEAGYTVHVVRDGVTSRKPEDKDTGLSFMAQAGAIVTCSETVLFQLLERAGTEEFKIISKRIK